MYEVVDIDGEILYWVEQFGYEWIDCGKLIDYIKENFVKDVDDILREWCELNEIRIDIDYLNWKMIVEEDNDYEYIGNGLYLNTFWLEDAEVELKRLDLIK